MIRRLSHAVGTEVDLGEVEVDDNVARRYADAIGVRPLPATGMDPPLGLVFALRGAPAPDVEFTNGTVSVHAGHTITLPRPFAAATRYHLTSRIAAVFEKNGRSGPLTVVTRVARLHDRRGSVAAVLEDQQIARWRPAGTPAAPATRPVAPDAPPAIPGRPTGVALHSGAGLDLGEVIALEHRLAPDPRAVLRYAQSFGGVEPLFVDRAFAHAIGYADVIVPGPFQAALLEHMLASHLPDWRLEQISLTFRVSVIAAEAIVLSALVIGFDAHDPSAPMVLDLTLENARGEGAAVGTATLRRRPHWQRAD